MNTPQLNEDKIQQGFSSEQQYKPQQIVYTQTIRQKTQHAHKEEIKFKLPPAQQIKDKRYSLHPDIITGWQPKIELPSPIPIIFQNPKYDNLIKRLLKIKSMKVKLCYLGPKYQNTYFAWYDKGFTFPYTHVKAPHSLKFSQRPFCGQHWQAQQTELKFDSFFQSGNLDCAIKVGQTQYDLFMRVDSNTSGHLQWFNFKITNLVKDKQYRINICNFQKKKILYGRGLKPYVLSTQRLIREKVGWEQRGQNVVFEKKLPKTLRTLGIQSTKYFRLSFTISTPYQNDELQFAYCIPYTFTQLSQYLHKKTKDLQKYNNQQILKMSKLCTSLGGLEVPLLIIHETHKDINLEDKSTSDETSTYHQHDNQIPIIKKCVIICGRAHPGESNGSYMIEGFLDFICGQSKMAEFLRKHVIFKIVPMMNPDGVALGNYRTGLSGRDFNREYRDPDKEIFPQVYAFKKLVSQNKFLFKDNLSVFLDFHGHSVKKNTFAYGPQFPIVNKFYYESRIFPKILGNLTPMFRYYSCSFKIAECKGSTARAVLLKKLNIPLSYTIQTSNGFYFDYQKLKDIPYTDFKWKQMGYKVCQALYHYTELLVKSQNLRHQKHKASKNPNKKQVHIHIRKTGRSVSHQKSHHHKHEDSHNNKQINYFQKPCHSIILQGIEDQNIKHLFEQIKAAQQQKQKHLSHQQGQQPDLKFSDDQLSQGSSDSQGQQDDLSSKQMDKLFKCIKNKKYKNLQKCRLSPSKRMKTDDLLSQKNEDDQISSSEKNKLDNETNNRMSQQIIVKKPLSYHHKSDTKKQFIFNLIQTKKRSNATKVINFNFGFHYTPQKVPTHNNNKQPNQKSSILSTRINFFDAANTSSKNDVYQGNQGNDVYPKNQKGNRFTDLIFRKTFNSATKQKYRQGSDRANIFITTNYGKKITDINNVINSSSNVNNFNTNFSNNNSNIFVSQKASQKVYQKAYQKSYQKGQRTDKQSQEDSPTQMITTCQTFCPSNSNKSSRFNGRAKKTSIQHQTAVMMEGIRKEMG